MYLKIDILQFRLEIWIKLNVEPGNIPNCSIMTNYRDNVLEHQKIFRYSQRCDIGLERLRDYLYSNFRKNKNFRHFQILNTCSAYFFGKDESSMLNYILMLKYEKIWRVFQYSILIGKSTNLKSPVNARKWSYRKDQQGQEWWRTEPVRSRQNKTGVISDPLGQTNNLVSSDHCFHLNSVIEKWGRTDDMCENSDPYQPWLWVGRVDQFCGSFRNQMIMRTSSPLNRKMTRMISSKIKGLETVFNAPSARIDEYFKEKYNRSKLNIWNNWTFVYRVFHGVLILFYNFIILYFMIFSEAHVYKCFCVRRNMKVRLNLCQW